MSEVLKILKEVNFFQSNTYNGVFKPNAIIFDWENTIIERTEVSGLGSSFNYRGRNKEVEFKFKHTPAKLIEKNDLIKFLELIKKLGIFCAVISNRNGELLRTETDYFGVTKYFNKIIGAGDSYGTKPMIDPMLLALSDTNIEFGKNVWYIGDSMTDMEFAFMTLSTGVLYKSPKNNNNIDSYESKSDFSVTSMKQLFIMLERISNSMKNQIIHLGNKYSIDEDNIVQLNIILEPLSYAEQFFYEPRLNKRKQKIRKQSKKNIIGMHAKFSISYEYKHEFFKLNICQYANNKEDSSAQNILLDFYKYYSIN